MSNFDNDMQVILSKVDSTNPNAPVMRINFEMKGQKYKAGLWVWTKKDGGVVTDPSGNKKYKGKIEVDNFVPQQAEPPAAADYERDIEESDIPF